MGQVEMTTTEGIVVVCIMLSLLVVGFWMRWRRWILLEPHHVTLPRLVPQDRRLIIHLRNSSGSLFCRYPPFFAVVGGKRCSGTVGVPSAICDIAIWLRLRIRA